MSVNLTCPQCGAPVSANDLECRYCGETLQRQVQYPPQQPQQYPQQPLQGQPYVQNVYMNQQPILNDGINPSWPIKSKVAAGLLAIFLGGLGIHKFYLGKVGMGILYLLFFWTYIPEIVGLIEGIVYLCSNDHNFQVKNQVRLK